MKLQNLTTIAIEKMALNLVLSGNPVLIYLVLPYILSQPLRVDVLHPLQGSEFQSGIMKCETLLSELEKCKVVSYRCSRWNEGSKKIMWS